jgi:hypothetical protein
MADMWGGIIAFLTLLTAFAAAYATWQAPRSAAIIAEEMRRNAQAEDEKRRMRLWIFSTVMQCRNQIWTPDCMRALNIIDLAFSDDSEVRRTWARLLDTLDPEKGASKNERRNALHDLMERMAASVGIPGHLTDADFDRIYYPAAAKETDDAQFLQRRSIIQSLSGQAAPETNTQSATDNSPFPPRPT